MRTYVLEAREGSRYNDGPWTESACGATGPGLTQFTSRRAADITRRGLVALGEGWTDANTRVREVQS